MNSLIVLNKNDNVGVSQFIMPEKTKIECKNIVTKDPIPFGHKVCLKAINKGEAIIKYDQINLHEYKFLIERVQKLFLFLQETTMFLYHFDQAFFLNKNIFLYLIFV